MTEKQVMEIAALDPTWAEQALDRDVFDLLPIPGGDARADDQQVFYRGPFILVTRVLGVYLRMSQVWEIYLISGKGPNVKRLSAAQGHISIFRRFEVRCELSPQRSLLEQEAVITIDPHWDSVLCKPEPIRLLISVESL